MDSGDREVSIRSFGGCGEVEGRMVLGVGSFSPVVSGCRAVREQNPNGRESADEAVTEGLFCDESVFILLLLEFRFRSTEPRQELSAFEGGLPHHADG